MIEIVENAVQFSVLLICAGVAAVQAIRARGGTAALLFFFYISYALADLYSILYLVFYDSTPQVFYVSDLGWYASYLYLFLLLHRMAGPEERMVRHPVLWLPPLFCCGMGAFYMQWGDYPGNIISVVLMSLLTHHAVRGLKYMRAHPEKAANRPLYRAALIFCAAEYCVWTASCFWSGDTWTNLYFLCDCLLTVCMALILPAYRKSCAGSGEGVKA